MSLDAGTYKTVNEMCEEDGVTYDRGKALLKAGYSIPEVATTLGISELRVNIYQTLVNNEWMGALTR